MNKFHISLWNLKKIGIGNLIYTAEIETQMWQTNMHGERVGMG